MEGRSVGSGADRAATDLLSFASFQDQAAEDLHAGHSNMAAEILKMPTNCNCLKMRDYMVASESHGISLYAHCH